MAGYLPRQLGLGTGTPPHRHEPDLGSRPPVAARRSAHVRTAVPLPGRPGGRQLVSVHGLAESPLGRRAGHRRADAALSPPSTQRARQATQIQRSEWMIAAMAWRSPLVAFGPIFAHAMKVVSLTRNHNVAIHAAPAGAL